MGAQMEILTPFFDVGQSWSTWAGTDGMANQGWAFGVAGGTFAPLARPHQIATDTPRGGPPKMAETGNAQDAFSLFSKWHVNGVTTNSLGSGIQGGSNSLTSFTLTLSTGTNIGGGPEPAGTFDLWFVAVVYEAANGTASIASVTDSIGGTYTKHTTKSLTVNSAVTQNGAHTYNQTYYMDIWQRVGQVVSPQTNAVITVTPSVATPLDSISGAAWAVSGSVFASQPYDTDAPFFTSGTIAASASANPSLGSVNTVSAKPLMMGVAATLNLNSSTLSLCGPTGCGATQQDPNDNVDGTLGKWSYVGLQNSGLSGFDVCLWVFFTQSTGGAVSGGTLTFTAADFQATNPSASPGGYMLYLDALRSS